MEPPRKEDEIDGQEIHGTGIGYTCKQLERLVQTEETGEFLLMAYAPREATGHDDNDNDGAFIVIILFRDSR